MLVLAVLAMGAGPCDMLGMLEAAPDAGAACAEPDCEDRLTVEILRADNDAFWPGAYSFEVALDDGTVYGIDCYLAHEASGFDCELGDTDVMTPSSDLGAYTIFLVFAGAPASAQVTVEYNGLAIGDRALAPDYAEVYPGGDETCAPCLLGEASMAVLPW